jgi:hypothetical protein
MAKSEWPLDFTGTAGFKNELELIKKYYATNDSVPGNDCVNKPSQFVD